MSKSSPRMKPMTVREMERQRAWAEGRRAIKALKESAIPAGMGLKGPASGGMLRVADGVPEAADYERLLVEAGDNRWAFEDALNGHHWEGWIDYIPQEFLGRIAVAAWLGGMPASKLRDIVEGCWGKGTPYVIKAAGCQLFNMLRACEWPLISELPEQVEIWRGARGQTVQQAGQGLCWTLDKDTACAWLRILEVNWRVKGAPLVIRRVVPRSAIAMVHVPGDLAEVVIEAEPGGEVDGTTADWERGRARWVEDMIAAGKMHMHDTSELEALHRWFLPGACT